MIIILWFINIFLKKAGAKEVSLAPAALVENAL
jgi:hypothetical protein